jgi:predicted dehydrogenase
VDLREYLIQERSLQMRIAYIGCGYAAEYYAVTQRNYPQLELAGVFDKNEERATTFSRAYKVKNFQTLDDLLGDKSISIVVNLTNVREHYVVTRACLEAGKHVYSEKPLAANFEEARCLVELARQKSLHISCAPASLLGETAQTLWKLLREEAIGKVWLVYAELDDGAIHQRNYRFWHNSLGIPWPYQDEFETGCTMEHAAYQLVWLTTFFGPAKRLNSFSSCVIPDKLEKRPATLLGDDLSVTCITFSSGVVARLTCSILAPKNHSLTIIGSEGVLTVEDCWIFESPIYIQKRIVNAYGFSPYPSFSEKRPVTLEGPNEESTRFKYRKTGHDMDFARGIAELANAIQNGRPPRLSGEHALHITEILSRITQTSSSSCEIKTSFPEITPMPWARERDN